MRVIDLSMPIEDNHFRWPITRAKKGDFAAGDLFEVTSIGTTCHGFTHMDAPCHMVPGGATLDGLDLARVVGPAAILDLSDIAPDEEITADRLDAAGRHLGRGEIALFKTCWDRQRDWRTEAFWRDAPWLSANACRWLHARAPAAVAFDFPQDWTIRRLLDGEMRPIEEHVSHDILLRDGITLIEYLVGTDQLTGSRTFLCALPIRVPNADGAPARVVALEGLETA